MVKKLIEIIKNAEKVVKIYENRFIVKHENDVYEIHFEDFEICLTPINNITKSKFIKCSIYSKLKEMLEEKAQDKYNFIVEKHLKISIYKWLRDSI